MKPFIFLLLMVYCSISFAQRADPGKMTTSVGSFGLGSLNGGNDSFVFGKGIDMNSTQYSEVNGSPFLNVDFKPAYIALKDGKRYNNVPVKFDMLHNELDMQRDKDLISILGIDSVSYSDSIYQNMILKTGYPSINSHDTTTLYQLMAQNDKIQLVKFYHCRISTIKTMGMPDKASFDVDDQYYLFNKATKTMKEIKMNKKSFSSAIADMGFSKADIDKNKDLNFRNEKEVAGLVTSMAL
jgi:hypothetical protein